MGYNLGVDLGTTFVAASLAVGGRVEMFSLGQSSEVTPAAVYLRDDGTLVTGEAAVGPRTANSTDRVAREFKRRLGDPTPLVLGGQPFTATALLGALLRDVVTRVVASQSGPPENVVLTHPANWGPFRRALFEEVVRLGGLAGAGTVTEPEAAATRYAASRTLAEGRTVAVYDLGGGTFDATVLRKLADGMEIVGTPEGVERLGGIDFDEAILRYVDYTSDGALSDLDVRDPPTAAALARLREDCILAKETLSADTETVLPVLLPHRHFEVRLTRPVFEDLIRAQVESTIGALARTLDSARVSPEELDAVLLIGGSSRIPLVAETVSAELGRPIAVDAHPKYAVALGAATLAARAPARNGAVLAAGQPGAAAWAGPAITAASAAGKPSPTEHPPPAYQPPPPPPPYQSPVQQPLPPVPYQQPSPPVGRQPAVAARELSWREQSSPEPAPDAPPPEPRQPPEQQQATEYQQAPKYQQAPGYPPPPRPLAQPTAAPPRSNTSSGTGRRRILLAAVLTVLLVATGVTAWVLLTPAGTPAVSPSGTPAGTAPGAPAGPARLVLTTDRVKIGDSYYLTASGFTSGEDVRLSWTGPTNGTMDAVAADPNGVRNHGPVIERDPPGNYVIIATGLSSGRTAEARLEVLPADPGS